MGLNVLVTGGAGFIGSHLVERLLASGDHVLVLDNYATARRDSLTSHPGLTIVEGSIADPDLVRRTWEAFRPELVVHAAASYRNPDDWPEDVRTNVLGTALVVQASQRAKVQRLIYLQTALCYGLRPLEQPITLAHPIRPEGSSYAISKTAGEQYVLLGGLDAISFRLANVFGPRNLSGPLPTFYARLVSGKPCYVVDTRRDFLFIQDMLDVVVKALNGVGRAGVYHISSGRDYAIKDLFEATVKALDLTPDTSVEVRPRNPDDAFTILLDPSRTNRDFTWQATTPLAEGVKAAIDWYRRHGVTQTYTHLRLEESKA